MKRISEIITVAVFCLIIASLSITFLIMPDKLFSPTENRNLEQAPKWEKESFFQGDFAKTVNVYFADQFPLRDWFVRLKGVSELAMLKGENNGVLYSHDQLAVKEFNLHINALETVPDTDRINEENIIAQLERINKLAAKSEIPLVTVIPPRTIDIADSHFSYNRPDGDRVFELLSTVLNEEAGYIDVLSPLRDRYEAGEYVYYRTDHHWTTYGAYLAYCDIMAALGDEKNIIPISDFTKEAVTDFSGTTASRGNFPFYKRDEIEIWHLPDEEDYSITVDGEALDSFYCMEYAEGSDKYGLFFDGTHNITTVTKEGEDRKTLLIAKDSFANCMIPFLARDYNIVAVDIKLNPDLTSLSQKYQADAMVIIYNAENLITSTNLRTLR